MTTMADQFKVLGIVSESRHAEVVASQDLLQEKVQKACDHVTLDELRQSKNMGHFKHITKQLLEQDKEIIGDIIKVAHEKYNENEGKKLFWILIRVRESLKNLPADKHQELFNRAFRKSGATPTISEHWN